MSKRIRIPKDDKENCNSNSKKQKCDISQDFLNISTELSISLSDLSFLKSLHVYDPTVYARNTFEQYVKKYCSEPKEVMFLGMNPGPWGMSQTGVPFGEVDAVKNWLNIDGAVGKPANELPSRPVEGFSCSKSEVSGKRFWGLMKELCGEPEVFFRHSFVYNYLPLQFISSSGKNIPPTLLKKEEQASLYRICDEALARTARLYRVELVVAVGKFAESRARAALHGELTDKQIRIVSILHPSPRSKAANNWRPDVLKQMKNFDILKYLEKNN